MPYGSDETWRVWSDLRRREEDLRRGLGQHFDSMGRHASASSYFNFDWARAQVSRVERVRQALEESGPVAKRLVAERLSGLDLSQVWDILLSAVKDIALLYGGSVLGGGVIGGVGGAFFGGVGAIPGAAAGATAGGYIGSWVLTVLGLGSFIDGMNLVAPEAFQHYEKGFREAWGPPPHHQKHGNGTDGNPSTAAFHMANGHVVLVAAILTVIVAYLTRGKGDKKAFLNQIAGSKRLGPKPARWIEENQDRLQNHPALQLRSKASAGAGSPAVPPLRPSAPPTPPRPPRAHSSVLKQTGSGSYTGSADELYDAIRASTTDVSAISSNTGIKAKNIQKVKDHVFLDEHLLDRYVDYGIPAEMGRFDSSLSQADAWLRLEKGNHTPEDIQWLKHETAERWFEKKYNSGYSKAHDAAEKRWPGNPWGL